MHKLYLSPSETRRYAVELPVGDPTGGIAYGKKAMPVVAVAMAASSFAAGVTAFGAATTLGGMVAAGAVMVGSAMTIIGVATKNSKLMKIGGLLTLGGGLAGGMANPFGGGEEAASSVTEGAASEAVSVGGEAINPAAHFSDAAFDAGLPSAASAPVGAELSGMAAEGALTQFGDAPASGLINQPSSMPSLESATGVEQLAERAPIVELQPYETQTGNAMNASETAVAQSAQQNAFEATTPQNALNPDPELARLTNQQAAAQNGQSLINGEAPTVRLANGEEGFFDRAGRWVKSNKELAYMGATFASGLFPSQRERAEADYARARADDARRRALWATGRIS